MKICIYIHGFNSTGNATKAHLVRAALTGKEVVFVSPSLSHDISAAMQQLRALLDQYVQDEVYLVGSSLGGFYTAVLTKDYPNVKAALVNPAIEPWVGFDAYIGEHVNDDTGERFFVTEKHIEELKQYSVFPIHRPQDFLLLLQTDDDVLDYQIALDAFPDSPSIVRTGGGHRFTDFEQVIPEIFTFFGI